MIDADALYFLAKNPKAKIPKNSILTPHRGEMEKLLQKKPSLKSCQAYVEKHHATLVLKGAPSMVFHPGKKPLVIAHGDPGMATAGSGDILTGIIAGLLAQKMTPCEAAALGVYLHARAGEIAGLNLTSFLYDRFRHFEISASSFHHPSIDLLRPREPPPRRTRTGMLMKSTAELAAPEAAWT